MATAESVNRYGSLKNFKMPTTEGVRRILSHEQVPVPIIPIMCILALLLKHYDILLRIKNILESKTMNISFENDSAKKSCPPLLINAF